MTDLGGIIFGICVGVTLLGFAWLCGHLADAFAQEFRVLLGVGGLWAIERRDGGDDEAAGIVHAEPNAAETTGLNSGKTGHLAGGDQ